MNNYKFEIEVEKMFDLKLKKRWISGSPIVLQVEKNVYWSRKYHSLDDFLKRLYENSVKKYNAYYGENLSFDPLKLFDKIKFKKQIAVHIKKHGKEIRIIGSKWLFVKDKIDNPKFYKFLFDCGLGEKNSLGFGFVNPA